MGMPMFNRSHFRGQAASTFGNAMPHRGSFGSRGGYRRGRTVRGFRGGNTLYKRFRGRSNNVQRAVKRELNSRVEWKHLTLTSNAAAVPSAGAITELCLVPQGTLDVERVGDKINATSLDLRYTVTGSAAGATTQRHRIVMFQWNNDSAPVTADILILAASLETKAEYNTDRAGMYKIMFDRTVQVGIPANGWNLSSVPFRRKFKIPNADIKFQAGSTVGVNKIFILELSESASNAPVRDLVSRLNFSDS